MPTPLDSALERIARAPAWGAMVPDYMLMTAQRLQAAIADPVSREEWERRGAAVRQQALHALGLDPLPERCPLRARVVGTLPRKGYRIEKVVYEARPGFPVAAHLYLPDRLQGPAPAVIHAPGHWIENAKLEADLQHFCVGMVQRGFVVLIYDPIGQGERRTNWYNHGEYAPLLVGLQQSGLLVWEGSRAVDYLLTRTEVDPQRIGFTGASGGGQMAALVPVVDSRVATSVSVCFSNTLHDILRALRGWNWNGGIDLCNQIPGEIAFARLSDLIGLHAPRPFLMICGALDSMFPIQGAREVFGQLDHIYRLMGSQAVTLAEVEAPHGYDQQMREIAYGWFMQRLQGQGSGAPLAEQPAAIEPLPYPVMYLNATADPEPAKAQTFERDPSLEVYCFEPNELSSPDPQIMALAEARAATLPPVQTSPADTASWVPVRKRFMNSVRTLLGPSPERLPMGPSFIGGEWSPPHVQITQRERLPGGWVDRIVIDSEPGVVLPALFLYPDRYEVASPVMMYLHDEGKEAALRTGVPQTLLAHGWTVLLLDLRGTGESAAIEFENVTTSWMLDRSWFSWQVWDITRAVDYLSERCVTGIQHDKQRIVCWGSHLSALEALYAAALDPRLAGVIAAGLPVSYRSLLVSHPTYPIGAYLFDVLNHFEVSQVASLLAPRPLLVTGAVDGCLRPADEAQMQQAFAWCRSVYRLLGAEEHLRVEGDRPDALTATALAWAEGVGRQVS